MTYDENGSTLDVGRRSRTVPAAIRRALEHRDRRCRFPGCDLRYCDAHHIVHWADGGTTALANLVLLCRRHHRAVHEAGFRIERDTAGELRFHHPNGRVIPDVPAAPTLQADLASRHEAQGIAVNSEALICFSTGQPLDVNRAIVTLRGAEYPDRQLMQNDFELTGETKYTGQPSYRPHGEAPIKLQAHGDPSPPISFRNIWVRELP